MQKGTAIAVPFLCFSGKGLWAAWAALAVRFFVFARFFCLFHAYLFAVQAIRPVFSGFAFGKRQLRRLRGYGRAVLYSLRLHLFCVPRLTASCYCPFLLFTKRRKPQRGKEGKGCPCLKGFCAPADARRRKLCIARFHAGVKTYSRRCVSFPPHKRCAGLCGGFGEVWHGRVSGCSTRCGIRQKQPTSGQIQ